MKTEALCRIPEALANDNFIGYVSSIIYKYKVRWIECVAASPVFTSLINYYVEGGRGHLLGERQHVPVSTGEMECGGIYVLFFIFECDQLTSGENLGRIPSPPPVFRVKLGSAAVFLCL